MMISEDNMTKYTQTQLENMVHRLRLVGAYDSVIADTEIDTCLEAARMIEEYADYLADTTRPKSAVEICRDIVAAKKEKMAKK
jgi:hypothetical protein